jgi:hypothetical protein
MGNPFHHVVETPPPNRVAGLKGWLPTDPRRLHQRPRVLGHRFSGRYQALLACSEAKLGLARRLRQETPLSLSWMAPELGIGRWKDWAKWLAERRTDQEQLGWGLRAVASLNRYSQPKSDGGKVENQPFSVTLRFFYQDFSRQA